MQTAIWWIRRDIRITHNPAFAQAIESAKYVLPVFILDPVLLNHPAEKRQQFLFQALDSLDRLLQSHGSRLIIQSGDPVDVLSRLDSATQAKMIYAEADPSPYARRRDQKVANTVPLCLVHGLTVFPPGMIVKNNGSPYTIFTPYKNAWKAMPFTDRPSLRKPIEQYPLLPPVIPETIPLPGLHPSPDFPAEQSVAEKRLDGFLHHGLLEYRENRDRMDLDGTSMLSAYLRFGLLSAPDVVHQLQSQLTTMSAVEHDQADAWLNELIWREFYISILHHFPEVLKASFRKDLRNIRWRNIPAEIEAWRYGQTGYPIVDAGMRQLLATGWMHNRARMITASFLVKDLLVNWQIGEAWFMQHLIDGDPASNNGGWQWTAGVGTDAAPYFRIFNPVLQGKKFDPQGAYIRRWVPEIAALPDQYIHTPWLLPLTEQARLGIHIGRDYPLPVVDHHQMRALAIAAYKI